MSLKERLRGISAAMVEAGIDPRKFVRAVRGVPRFVSDLRKYESMAKNSSGAMPVGALYPILADRSSESGVASGHYFHQDLWAARKIFLANPGRHVDVASSVEGLVAHLLVFREVEVMDIRKLSSDVRGLKFIQDDATEMKLFSDDSVESISSLHAGEHFGLGRCGDPIDPVAHLKFMAALKRVLRPAGRLYYAVPCGIEKLYFNAHRVLAPRTVLSGFSGLRLLSFSCVKDDGKLYENCSLDDVLGENYGCGLFEFTKDESSRGA